MVGGACAAEAALCRRSCAKVVIRPLVMFRFFKNACMKLPLLDMVSPMIFLISDATLIEEHLVPSNQVPQCQCYLQKLM